MTGDDQSSISADVSVGGDLSGQVAVGRQIQQQQVVSAEPVTPEELAALQERFRQLEQLVADSAPPETRDAALERVGELEAAITAEEPDLSTMEYVRNWFTRNLPKLAGAVTGLVVNPIVGKLVGAAGEALAGEFRRRFLSE